MVGDGKSEVVKHFRCRDCADSDGWCCNDKEGTNCGFGIGHPLYRIESFRPRVTHTTGDKVMSSGYTTGWQEDLVDYLISAGTQGRNVSEILRRFQNRVASDQITSELESYQVEGRVQKFTYPPKGGKGRPTTVWRATTKMVELDNASVIQVKEASKVKSAKINKKTNGKTMEPSGSRKPSRSS